MKPSNHNYYFDYASTTPVDKTIADTYFDIVKKYYANSESTYKLGLEVHNLVETSRRKIAGLLRVLPEEVIFTSGASEANSFALKGYALKNKHKGKHIITSKMEHSSIINACKQLEEEFGFQITYLPVPKDGVIILDQVKEHMRNDTIMVCLMALNNEIGSIQNVEEIAMYLKQNTRICFFCDGVQIVGKHPFDLSNVDLFTFTTHKFYGVKGCGVLIKKKNIELLPLIHGGQQEQGIRGGTMNAPVCIVAAKTLRMALETQDLHLEHVSKLYQKLKAELSTLKQVDINSPENGSPYILNFSCSTMNSEIMMNALNERNIFVSSQSACSSRTKQPSHTLLAMNYEEKRAISAIRISLSHHTTDEEVEYLLTSIKEIIYEYST